MASHRLVGAFDSEYLVMQMPTHWRVWERVEDRVGDQIWDLVWVQVLDQVREQVFEEFGGRVYD